MNSETRMRRGNSSVMVLLLSLVLIFGMSTWFSAAAVLPQLQKILQISQGAGAWLTISVQIGFVFGALISSILNLSDIVLPKHVIFAGALGSAVVNLLIQSATTTTSVILLRFGTGFFLAGVYPPAFKILSTWFKERRGLALGILAAAIVLGNGVPHLVNGLGGLNWRLVINSTSVLALMSGLIAEFFVYDGPFPFPKAVFDPRQINQIISNRGVRMAALGYIGHMWELFALFAWFPLFFTDFLLAKGIVVGTKPSFAAFLLFSAGAVGCWLGGVIATRIGKINTNILMLAISGTCSLTIGLLFNAPLWVMIFMTILWGISVVADSAQFSALVTEYAHQSYVGTALSLQLASGFTITVVTIWLIPLLQENIGWKWAFAFLAPGPILGILSMLRLKSGRTITNV